MDPEFRRRVKDALDHLYDTAYLQVHPLLSLVAETAAPDRTTRAQRLRGLLKDSIEALRPQQGSPSTSPEWRSYLALRYHYVQGMRMGQVTDELGISLRQLQRELHKGIDAVAHILWDMHTATPAASPSAQSDELEELRNELSNWDLDRQPCDLRALVADTVTTLQPVLATSAESIQIGLPPLPPVLVDSTLTRQALFKIVRLAMEQGEAPVSVTACLRQRHVDLLIRSAGMPIESTALDWQMAELLIGHQGGSLFLRQEHGEPPHIVVSLPCANQMKVLVIDDNQAIHRLFERYLAPQQYIVLHAVSADEGLRLAMEAAPDVITLDVMMPNIDGWQLLRSLVQTPATRNIPVVVCSVLREPELALSMGARAYLKKPVERAELLTTLARLCSPAAPSPAVPPTGPAAD